MSTENYLSNAKRTVTFIFVKVDGGYQGIGSGFFVGREFGEKKNSAKLHNALTYSDGTQFLINGNPEDIVSELLANGVRYKNDPLSYPMKCMLLVWNLRNFSAHNLSGIDYLLTNSYHSILSMIFSALLFAAEIL